MSACERACVYVLDGEKDGTASVCVLLSTVMLYICICLATNLIPLIRS